MTLPEIAWRIFAEIQPALPYVITVAVITLILLPVLLFLSRSLWVSQRRFRWLSLFFGLKAGECVRVACSWIKLLLVLSYLIAFQKLGLIHYGLLLVPGLLYVFSPWDWLRIPGRFLWLALEMAGLLSCNLICGYIREMSSGPLFPAVYCLMAFLEGLFAFYLFLTEINDISAGRALNLEREWKSGRGDPESD